MGRFRLTVLVAVRGAPRIEQAAGRVRTKNPPFPPSCSCLCNLGFHRFCLNIGWLYTRLVASNSSFAKNVAENEMEGGEVGGDHPNPNEETPLLPRRLNNSIEEFMAMYGHSLRVW